MKTVRVLLVEHGATDAQVTSHALSAVTTPRLDVSLAATLADALMLVAERDFDVILLDVALPDAQRLEAIHALRPATPPETAIVVLSAQGDETLALAALRCGAEDYLAKENLDSDGLRRSLTFAMARRRGELAERLRATESVAAAEESFRLVFDESPIGMALISLDGRFLRINEALLAITGHAREELEGSKIAAIAYPGDHASDVEGLRELVAGRTTHYDVERRYVHAAGHPIWIALSVTCIRDGHGEPLHFLGQIQDVTDRRRFEQRLQHMADHDPLTGLLNRRAFERELTSQVARNERYGIEGAVLIIDLDHFKYCNDTLGHRSGDELLVRVAHVLAERVRASDVLARLGGDEFAVLLPREADEAHDVAAVLMDAIRGEEGVSLHGNRYDLTASIGVARFDQEHALGAEGVLVNADLAMYDAKQAGRDCIAFYRPGKAAGVRARGRVKWVQEIRGALEEERFTLLAQPIIHLRGTSAHRYELLLRLRDRQGDMIPPGTFLYIAERLDLIQEIDRWVVARATGLLARHPDLELEVNLSGKSIGASHLLEQIQRDLRRTEVAPSRLTFEITETTAVANIAHAREFAGRLSELGCQFALDDFGSGFGSFYYLKHLPFDYLKIDGEFVRNCATNQTDRLLVTSVVNIARGLGKQTIAEFVRDEDTVAALRELGVDWGQGFHLGRPAPLADQLGAREITA